MKQCVAVVISLLAAGCASSGYSSSYTRVQASGAYLERKDGGPVQIAYYTGGELHGAEAALRDDFPLRGWLHGAEAVDNPSLGRWRQQLADLRRIAAAPGTDVTEITRAGRDFPFAGAVDDAVRVWAGTDPQRAAALLDRIADIDVSDDVALELAQRAAAGQEIEDARLARWIRGAAEDDHDEMVEALLDNAGLGRESARAALDAVDDYATAKRRAIFERTAPMLAVEPAEAARLLTAVGELRSSDQEAALLAVLDAPVSPELLRQVLRHIDDRRTSARLPLFTRAALLAKDDPINHFAIVSAVEDLPTADRLEAVLTLAREGTTPSALVVLLVEAAEQLSVRDREEMLESALAGPHGGDASVRNACEAAARESLGTRARERILKKLGA